jgi:hypothetical protein
LALAIFTAALTRADAARRNTAIVVGYQWVRVSTIKRIIITVSVRVERISSLQEFPVVRPAVVIRVEEVVLAVRGVEPIQYLPAVPTASAVSVWVHRVSARAEFV